jgi:hypothetical protein
MGKGSKDTQGPKQVGFILVSISCFLFSFIIRFVMMSLCLSNTFINILVCCS